MSGHRTSPNVQLRDTDARQLTPWPQGSSDEESTHQQMQLRAESKCTARKHKAEMAALSLLLLHRFCFFSQPLSHSLAPLATNTCSADMCTAICGGSAVTQVFLRWHAIFSGWKGRKPLFFLLPPAMERSSRTREAIGACRIMRSPDASCEHSFDAHGGIGQCFGEGRRLLLVQAGSVCFPL